MKKSAPLTQSQYGIYVDVVNRKNEASYNIPYLFTLDISLDADRVRCAIEKAIMNHPTLFTRISLDDSGEPVQSIDIENEQFSLPVEEITDIEGEKKKLIKPFNIYGDRLFRTRLMRDQDHLYWFLDMHHIIADGASRKVLMQDVDMAYRGEPLTTEAMSLGEVAREEFELRKTKAFEEARRWYAQTFDCGDIYTQLVPDLEVAEHSEGLMKRELHTSPDRVDEFCKSNGIFKSTLFTSVYAFLLAKYNSEQESLFETIYNGRTDKRLLHSIGMTVKTFPVYARFNDETTVLDYLKDGQEQIRGCREHEAYAYGDVVRDLRLQCNTSFAWHGMLFADEQMMGKPMQMVRLNNNTRGNALYVKAFIRGSRFFLEAEYSANDYSEALMAQFMESYEAALEGFLSQTYLRDIEIATKDQIAVLDGFNQTDVPFDESQTIVSLFRRQVAAAPDKVAVVYQDKKYTYKQVDELSDSIAYHLASKGYGSEDVVSVLIPRCEWMAIASIGVLKAGCAYQPLDPSYPKERLEFMMKDSATKTLIADKALLPLVDFYQGETLFTSDIVPGFAAPVDLIAPTPHSLMTMIYTSGTTGVPKGCQVEHRNVVAFCHMHQACHHITSESRIAAYASFGFDASIEEIYGPLTIGAQLYIIPEEMRLDLMALNEYFEQNGITHAFMTTQVAFQFATNFECKSLQRLLTGGEKLPSMAPPKNYIVGNGYGPSESICYVTNYDVTDKRKNIPIGKAQQNVKCYIVDKQGHRLPIGAPGELWVAGPQVTRGYLNRPEKTAEVYLPNPFDREEKYSRVYRSGDIVRYLPSGDVEFVGRKDSQVKIRGFRVELKEVESIIRDYPGIKDATVQAFEEEGGGKYIVAYIVANEKVDVEALNAFIMEEKPPYMVPAVTMQIEAIPLNQNQKVNKKALPKPEKKSAEALESHVPMNVLEKELHAMIADIVGEQDFGVTTVLGYVGLTSISSIKLAVQLNKKYGITVDPKQLVKSGNIQFIENEILNQLLNSATDSPKLVENDKSETDDSALESVPLSYAQTGVYFECLKNPASTVYNIPFLLTYPRDLDAQKLADTVKTVAESHPELFVRFETEGDSLVQTLKGREPLAVDVLEMTDDELASYKRNFVKPFNLRKSPLCHIEVVKTASGVHLLMDTHHLVFDGGSTDLFIRQLNAALEGREVEEETYSYFDFVSDQQKAKDSDTFRMSQKFFDEKLQTCEGASEIPIDMPVSDRQGLIGEAVCPVDHARLASFCRGHGITPAHLFFAATAYTVSRYTNSRDVYLCTVSSGRSNLKIADTVGMFVNTLALGLSIDDVTVAEFLRRACETFDQTLRHEDYPFARIASDYGFQPAIAYVYQVGVISNYALNGKAVHQELLELNVPKFKIDIKIEDRGVVVQYDDSLYSAELGQALAESIQTVANNMMEHVDGKVRKISIVSENQEAVLSRIRQVDTADVPFRFLHDTIRHFAEKQPDHQALIAIDNTYSFRELDELTDRIACALYARGVRERDRVALLLPRTSRLILSIFGVLKTGAAYIPCDPEYPADRIKLILEDSEARYIITTADRMATVTEGNAIDVEELLNDTAVTMPQPDITPEDLAYLIYTSGSTGRPKGVMIPHRGICNYAYGHPANEDSYAMLTDAERVLCVSTISFDAALQDIAQCYSNGKTLVLATEEQGNNPIELSRLINEVHVNVVSGTPSRVLTWLTSDDFVKAISHVSIVRCGGEKFSVQLFEQIRAATKARIFNDYGPTETSVACNNKELTNAERITVGKPQLNVKEYIVDVDGNELPVGVVGELYIGGRGVGRGYNNLEEKTNERFIQYKGERVYKSGDYAKWLPDGDVVILGRTDNQIKLRGLRIELGEIENVMLKVKGIKKVVVTIRKIGGKEHLCAYYTANRTVAAEEIKDEISKSLTQYMVPTAYLQMDAMPMTPNGKTDMKALPDPVPVVNTSYEEPVNDTERIFCNIFADILEMDKVGATDNFFELGGTSLVVTRVIIEADKAGAHVAYGDVFANPTPRELAALITGETVQSDTGDDAADFDYGDIDKTLEGNDIEAFKNNERQPLGHVLLTGATGYLGIHILKELIGSDAEDICCLVRDKDQNSAERRLKTLLFYYFENAYSELFGNRLKVVLGDVTNDLNTIVKTKVDTVFNCAAVVKHFSEGTEIEDVNIGGAQRCVDFCLNTGARLVHISTSSTRGLRVNDAPAPDSIYTEQKLYMGQYLGNQYIYSKFMAERLILQAIAKHGLSAKIMRVGNLSARSTDGEFQVNFGTNTFMGRIKVYNMLGCFPYSLYEKRVEFSPINEVAHAIILLASTPTPCCVFHPYNDHTQFLGDVLFGLRSLDTDIRLVEKEEYDAAMEAAGNDPAKAKVLSSLLAYQDVAHGMKSSDVECSNAYTMQVLFRLGFRWSATTWDYIEKMLNAIGGLGFFD
ncbi:MAG: amino acid adenylation domain-containing protein [Bacteroidales bacterium]|nr:amino acid adenylation domain-containing protein [Bacteroidales bacterium]